MSRQTNGTAQGRQCNFLEFLESYTNVIIPIIQRDYAQGRVTESHGDKSSTSPTSLYEEVRSNFVGSLKSALTGNKALVLDYIYGSVTGSSQDKIFYPIDGQQRLTTLFLLHWYIATKEGKLDEVAEQNKTIRTLLKEFKYETRDTAQEFCTALTDMNINICALPDMKDALSAKIKDNSAYYNVYNYDPTVRSMLVMLDALHQAFSTCNELWDNLKNITFWELDLQNFGLTDDLFVKMNARGKRLSRFDMFKSDLESDLKKKAKSEGKTDIDGDAKTWVTEIDNEYLDKLWAYNNNNCERNMFRICMFLAGCFGLIRDNKAAYDEKWITNDKEAPYHEQIKEIAENSELLSALCRAFETFGSWSEKDDSIKGNLLLTFAECSNWVHNSRVRIFAIIYWHVKITGQKCQTEYDAFLRVLNNYIYRFREPNIREGQFASSISNATIAPRFKFIKTLIDDFFKKQGSFNDFIRSSTDPDLAFEREKLLYSNFAEIEALEKLTYLGRNIQNFFHDNKIWITADELDTIVGDTVLTEQMLRIILSFADNSDYGKVDRLVFDKASQQTRRNLIIVGDDRIMAYYHKFAISKEAEFGDKILTSHAATSTSAEIKDLHKAVVKFAEEYAASREKTPQDKLKAIYESRLKTLTFQNDGILDYIIRYKEFYCGDGFYLLVRKHYTSNDSYDIYCTDREQNIKNGYYQPFYCAIANRLQTPYADYTANKITEGYILPNGWRLILKPNGQFVIEFNGNQPQTYAGKDSITVSATGDCIVYICNFLNNIM